MPTTMDKLSPQSPGYPTSDLGSSPRSSISLSHRDSLTIGLAGGNGLLGPYTNWAVLRDFAQQAKQLGRTHSSHSDYGEDSADDLGGHLGGLAGTNCNYLSPGQALSPAPFSPFSDCCIDSSTNTPYSNRSPNLSPLPSSMHFRLANWIWETRQTYFIMDHTLDDRLKKYMVCF